MNSPPHADDGPVLSATAVAGVSESYVIRAFKAWRLLAAVDERVLVRLRSARAQAR